MRLDSPKNIVVFALACLGAAAVLPCMRQGGCFLGGDAAEVFCRGTDAPRPPVYGSFYGMPFAVGLMQAAVNTRKGA